MHFACGRSCVSDCVGAGNAAPRSAGQLSFSLAPHTRLHCSLYALRRELLDSQCTFDYALALIDSESEANADQGIEMMYGLTDRDFQTAECLFHIARAYLALGQITRSREMCERLLQINPDFQDAWDLHEKYGEIVYKDGPVGLLAMGGLAVAGAFALRALWAEPEAKEEEATFNRTSFDWAA